MKGIIEYLDKYLMRSGLSSIGPVEANALLVKAGLLHDSKDRPGKPIRDLLRKGLFPHAFQSGGKGSGWTIPHSSKRMSKSDNFHQMTNEDTKFPSIQSKDNFNEVIDISQLKELLERARLKYKPEEVKYLLVAEAPPDSLERFFYYENVLQHDYLFLGAAEALYPKLKDTFLLSGRNNEIKNLILENFKADGFYLLDLSELPLSFLNDSLSSQVQSLIEKIDNVVNTDTKIILIKATVYDKAFFILKERFHNLIDVRIPFPGQGGQKKFQIEFKKALIKANYGNKAINS